MILSVTLKPIPTGVDAEIARSMRAVSPERRIFDVHDGQLLRVTPVIFPLIPDSCNRIVVPRPRRIGTVRPLATLDFSQHATGGGLIARNVAGDKHFIRGVSRCSEAERDKHNRLLCWPCEV